MLGELLGQGSGKRTGVRVLPPDGQSPKVEVSIQGSGTLLGHNASEFATYWQTFKEEGVMYGEGQDLYMTEQGDVAVFKGFGIGISGPGGAIRYTGSGTFQTSSERLARLNSVAAVFEFEVDGEGNYSYKTYEWK
ncbi:MAG: hypothetical protein HYT96_01875 [Armatimonadetes bacterium]|nr:hypothetical protein [Armatimonadota bacterium]